MTIVTPGVVPASELLQQGRPPWLDRWGRFAAEVRLRDLVVREDPSLTAMLPGLRPARLRLRLSDGRTLSAAALTNKGDAEDPYSAGDMQEKFRELAEPVWGGDHAALILRAIDDLERSSGVDELCRLLAHSPKHGLLP